MRKRETESIFSEQSDTSFFELFTLNTKKMKELSDAIVTWINTHVIENADSDNQSSIQDLAEYIFSQLKMYTNEEVEFPENFDLNHTQQQIKTILQLVLYLLSTKLRHDSFRNENYTLYNGFKWCFDTAYNHKSNKTDRDLCLIIYKLQAHITGLLLAHISTILSVTNMQQPVHVFVEVDILQPIVIQSPIYNVVFITHNPEYVLPPLAGLLFRKDDVTNSTYFDCNTGDGLLEGNEEIEALGGIIITDQNRCPNKPITPPVPPIWYAMDTPETISLILP